MNVLAVGANPDDIEILCAGTLAKYAQQGDKVTMCYVTTGDKGSTSMSAREIAEIRKEETEKSASIIGADLYPLGFPDGEVEVNLGMRRKIVEIIRKAKPEVIITHHPIDYMSDHTNTGCIVFEAGFWSLADGFEGDREVTRQDRDAGKPTALPPVTMRPQVYFMDTIAGIGFVPEEYVDISDVMQLKIEMLSCHRSQLKHMKDQAGIDLLDFIKTSARYRGYQCGTEYAEGFILERKFLTVRAKRNLP